MAGEDFTTLLAETDKTEEQAAKAHEKPTQENRVSRASKETEAKGSEGEVKSLKVSMEISKQDVASASAELDAVNKYVTKLKPK